MSRIQVFLAIFLIAAAPPPSVAPTGWRLTFTDDFDTFDLARWQTEYPWGARYIKQGEMQMYVDPSYAGDTTSPLHLDPFSVRDGVLTIRADLPPPDAVLHLQGQQYTSGLITTYGSFSQLYGYFEMRARLPKGRGLWPAFWLLPTSRTWPPEIDVMEVLGHQTTIYYGTVHMRARHGRDKVGFELHVPDLSTDFHQFGVLWTPEVVAWYFDGTRLASTATPSDMHTPMYILINLAVGGQWPGSPDNETKFPADMQIDYVRVYGLPNF